MEEKIELQEGNLILCTNKIGSFSGLGKSIIESYSNFMENSNGDLMMHECFFYVCSPITLQLTVSKKIKK